MSLSLISNNFHQMAVAIERIDRQDFPLAASQTNLYQADSILGMVHGALGGRERVKETVRKTAEIFETVRKECFEPVLASYKRYLTDLSLGFFVKELEIHPLRKQLQAWEQAAFPFLKLMQNPTGKAQKFLDEFFIGNPFIIPEWNEWLRYQTILNLEGITCGTIPMHDIMVLSHSGDRPSEAFQAWFKRLNEIGLKDDQKGIHRGLEACVEHVSEALKMLKRDFNVVRLEYILWNNGYEEVFSQPDAEHVEWRNSLRVGDTLGGYTISRQLGGKLHGLDKQLVFEVAESDEIVLIVKQNQSLLHMRDYVIKENANCYVLGYESVDPSGRFAVMEKLVDHAEGYPWKEVKQLTNQEKTKLVMRISVAQKLLSLRDTPLIDLRHFRCTKKGELKCLKAFIGEEFHFNHIEEDLIYKTSEGNPEVYRYLAKETQIYRHPYFKFYRACVRAIVKDHDLNISHFGGDHEIGDGTLIARAEELHKEILALSKEVYNAALLAGTVLGKEEIEKRIGEEIISHYDAFLSVGRLLDHVKAAVIKKAQQQSLGGP